MINLSELELALNESQFLILAMVLGLIALLFIMFICDGILRLFDL